ncbi:hypothetical protein IB75_13505 [Nitrosococcus oceani C-27]|uniref:Uncharacterized protein n=1 Tax=Nitrosococcus oceani C-27 TaxID=314279 RepID=A0A0E2YYU2_9GAMM|nr:hypothetical protein IB75_13505 [Nitrosococcus oceani C-27]
MLLFRPKTPQLYGKGFTQSGDNDPVKDGGRLFGRGKSTGRGALCAQGRPKVTFWVTLAGRHSKMAAHRTEKRAFFTCDPQIPLIVVQ